MIQLQCLCILLLAAGTAFCHVEMVLMPRNEVRLDGSLQEFWERLVLAVEERDADWVISALSPAVRNTFGDDWGIDSFHEIWQPYSAESPLWTELERITSMGGTFFDSTLTLFLAPYVYSCWPEEVDAWEYGAVTAANVPLYAEPDEAGEILGVLSYDVVRIRYRPRPPDGWRTVELTDGTPGYVREPLVRSPVDYRMGIERFPTGWEIVFLLAGD